MKVLERTADGFPSLFFSVNKMTMMSARESLLRFEKIPQPDGRVLYITSSVEHPDYPVTDKAIRIYVFKASMCQEVQDGLIYTEFATFNLGGWFPQRLLNMMMSTMATAGIEKMLEALRNIPK